MTYKAQNEASAKLFEALAIIEAEGNDRELMAILKELGAIRRLARLLDNGFKSEVK